MANLMRAYKRARINKRDRLEVQRFHLNLYSNLARISDALLEDTYIPSKYRHFMVYDPKEREVLALPFPDRIVHQLLVEHVIKPYYVPRFISDSYACIPNRGTHRAVVKTQKYMRAMNIKTNGKYWIVKMDVSKFFYSIDKAILLQILERDLADPALRRLFERIIYDGDDHDGIPIGNYVSQYFANIYLNELDQYCKHQLKIKYYVRYMDDFVMLAPDKATARLWYDKTSEFLNQKLNLKVNPKSRYFRCQQGLDFAGYIIHNDYMRLRRRSKKKLKEIIHDFENDIDDETDFERRIQSWHGHAGHANAIRYIHKHLADYYGVLPPNVFESIQSK